MSLGDGRHVEALGTGDIQVNMTFKVSKQKNCVMRCVLYVPKLTSNLFSVRAAVSKGNTVRFTDLNCFIKNRKGKLIGMGSLVDNKLYKLNCKPVVQVQQCASSAFEKGNSADLWHRRLGHLGKQQMREVASKELVRGITISKNDELSFCESCIEGKLHRKPFERVGGIRSTRKLQCVHSDMCGSVHFVQTMEGSMFLKNLEEFLKSKGIRYVHIPLHRMEQQKD